MARPSIAIIAAGLVLAAGLAHTPLMAQKRHDDSKSRVTYKQGIKVSNETILPDGRIVFRKVDRMPEYKGDLQAFLASNIQYPEDARQKKAEGRSIVRFIVSSDGRVSDAEIVRSAGNLQLDNESLRVVNEMQDWTPGVQDGYPVAVFFYLPISYSLD